MHPIEEDGDSIRILDQTRLPQEIAFVHLRTLAEAAEAISRMQVRGAPLIGATAAWGVFLGLREGRGIDEVRRVLAATRPTAVNLHWALQRVCAAVAAEPAAAVEAARREARAIVAADAAANAAIGEHGLKLLQRLAQHAVAGRRAADAGSTGISSNGNAQEAADSPQTLNIMTHCNAGWLATTAHGTALAPIYAAHAAALPLHVWVSETRPRNQGLLTAWELAQAGAPHTLMVDNAAGLLLMRRQVDCVIVGADRIAANGDVANKVGTYLKALAAHAHDVPFYVAAPLSTIDFDCPCGADIPVEERSGAEINAGATPVANPAFDITPAALVAGVITERGVFAADSLHDLRGL